MTLRVKVMWPGREVYHSSEHIVTCRPTSRQRQKYARATIEKGLQKVYLGYALYPLLDSGLLNTFPRQRILILLRNGAVNMPSQMKRCFLWIRLETM
jgi:hypothetical protein